MKIGQSLMIGMIVTSFAAANVATSSSLPNAPDVPIQIVVTAAPASGVRPPDNLEAEDLAVTLGNAPARIVHSQRLTGDLAGMQLFILLDDSTRSSSLGVQLPELKAFIASLPATTEVAIGYMRNGTFGLVQGFTADHAKAANALRLPEAIPGGNGSPYFALSDLVKHWPSKESTNRRAVLMLTDGVDRYYDTSMVDDPYVDASAHDAVIKGVIVYSIYLRDAGFYDRGDRATLFAQSRLDEVSQETGGNAYFQDFTDPVSVSPFLNDLRNRLDHQYQLTINAFNGHGVRPVKVRSEISGVKIQGPTRVYVQ
jgi:hypothetical protein